MLLIFWIFLQRLLLFCPQSTVECGVGRRTPGNQSQEQQSVNHTSLPMGDGPACAHDVIVRHQLKGERWHFISARLFAPSLSLSVTYIMRGLYVSHNWSHMSVFSLQQEAQSRAQACRRPTRPPTASRTAPEVHRVCWQGDVTPARHTRNHQLSVYSTEHQQKLIILSKILDLNLRIHFYELSSQHCSFCTITLSSCNQPQTLCHIFKWDIICQAFNCDCILTGVVLFSHFQ